MLTRPTYNGLLIEVERLRRHVAYYQQIIADCEIICDPAEKAVDTTDLEKNTYPQANAEVGAPRPPRCSTNSTGLQNEKPLAHRN